MEDDALIKTAAAIAAEGIGAIDIAGWSRLLLVPSDPLLTTVYGIAAEAGPDVGLVDSTELGHLPDPASPEWTEVEQRVDTGEYGLWTGYYLELALQIRALSGVPVLVYDLVDYQEQLARQEDVSSASPASRERDILVSVQVDAQRVAAVYRDSRGEIWATSSLGYGEPVPAFGQPYIDLGVNPVVVAGPVPIGAASVALRVGREPWVEPHQINRGFWIRALDDRVLTKAPDLAYRDADGIEFAIEVPFAGTDLPRLSLSRRSGTLRAYGATNVVVGEGWRVEVTRTGLLPVMSPGEALAEELGLDAAQVPSRPIAGSVLGHLHGWALAVHGEHWIAIADCGAFAVAVSGSASEPQRLDAEELRSTYAS